VSSTHKCEELYAGVAVVKKYYITIHLGDDGSIGRVVVHR
jgi:hypothetical protein